MLQRQSNTKNPPIIPRLKSRFWKESLKKKKRNVNNVPKTNKRTQKSSLPTYLS